MSSKISAILAKSVRSKGSFKQDSQLSAILAKAMVTTDLRSWELSGLPPLHSFRNLLSSVNKDLLTLHVLLTMKISLFIAALLGITFQAVDASTHLRVHILTELARAGEQCEWEDKAKKCEADSFCQNSDKHTGFCMKRKPGLNEQCGGKGVDGPWAVPCNASNLKCVLESATMSRCKSSTE